MCDLTIIQYAVAFLVNLYGAILFGWWWAKNKNASVMFICVTVLFLGGTIEDGFAFLARYIKQYESVGAYLSFIDSNWWDFRITLGTLASLFVVLYMTVRVIRSWNQLYGRRKEDDK
jgi:hypothetical protein